MAARNKYKFHPSKTKNEFLNVYIQLGTVGRAAEKLGWSRQTHYRWMREDEKYAEAYEKAKEITADLIEEEAWRRAVEGYEKRVYGREDGEMKLIRSERVYSDHLLGVMLKGRKPEYREGAEVNASVNVSVADIITSAQERVKRGGVDAEAPKEKPEKKRGKKK